QLAAHADRAESPTRGLFTAGPGEREAALRQAQALPAQRQLATLELDALRCGLGADLAPEQRVAEPDGEGAGHEQCSECQGPAPAAESQRNHPRSGRLA